MRYITTLLFLFLYTSVYTQSTYSIATIPNDLKQNANSILLDEQIVVDVSQVEKLNISAKSVRAVLNKKGDNDVSSAIAYDNDTRVVSIEAFVYDAFGNEIKHFKKRDFNDVSKGDGISLFNDDRALYLNYTPSSYPYIFEFIYETESKSTAFLPSWMPIGYYWRSTASSSYTLKFDPNNKPRMRQMNLDGYDMTISEGPNLITCRASNIKAIRYEAHSLPFQSIAPYVNFKLDNFHLMGVRGYAENWNDFGNWYRQNLLDGLSSLSPATVQEIKDLVANETTDLARAKKIYQYVQNKVRYISIQIGVGGWKPMLASDVDKLGYGDCKALTNYTKALLDIVGIPSYYTILYAGDDEIDISNDFVAIQGNHVILGIPNDEKIVWLECTSQVTPFGFGGNFSDDRDVLIVTPEGGKIVHTKVYDPTDNLQENKADIRMDASGTMVAQFQATSRGLQFDDKYFLEIKKKEELEAYYKERWGYINGFTIDEMTFLNDKDEIVFTEKLRLHIPNYLSKAGTDYLFCPNVFKQSQYIPQRISERQQKLHLSEGFEDIDILSITLTEGLVFNEMPSDEQIENKFGHYSIIFEKLSENQLKYTRKLLIKKGTFPPSEYKNYRNFRKQIAKLDKTKLLLTQN